MTEMTQDNHYMNTHEQGLLRFTTAGSVDDGKSTLIGRLLYDSKSIFEDQIEQIELTSKKRGHADIDLSLLTDGLRAEREQGITIDVAYRYFATPKRKFIIADTPGHIQYTRNMVTGASTANLAIILVDARNGVLEQTIRHSYIAGLLNIKHIIYCINKMDLVDFSENRFNEIVASLRILSGKVGLEDEYYLPISAKLGDNVVDASENMPWYKGESLLHLLETIEIDKDWVNTSNRFPVQYVVRPQSDEFHDYRGYAGRIAGGRFRQGESVTVLPAGVKSSIRSIDQFKNSLPEACFGDSVILSLEDDIDISRGDMIVNSTNQPAITQDLTLVICWFNEQALRLKGKYIVRHTSAETRCVVQSIEHKINIDSISEDRQDKNIQMNDIARITIRTAKPLMIDPYHSNRITGSLILIDEATNETMGAGMIC
jgi:sulfate adenylyltransferase subunit 1